MTCVAYIEMVKVLFKSTWQETYLVETLTRCVSCQVKLSRKEPSPFLVYRILFLHKMPIFSVLMHNYSLHATENLVKRIKFCTIHVFTHFRPALVASVWLLVLVIVNARLTMRPVMSAVNLPMAHVCPPLTLPEPPWELSSVQDDFYKLAFHAKTFPVTVIFSTAVCVWIMTVHSVG